MASFTSSSEAPKKRGFVAPVAPKCWICDKSVYKMEEVIAISKTWHKTCFTCGGKHNAEGDSKAGCKKGLTLDTYLEHDKEPYCQACHRRNFGAKGFGFGINTLDTEAAKPVTAIASESCVPTNAGVSTGDSTTTTVDPPIPTVSIDAPPVSDKVETEPDTAVIEEATKTMSLKERAAAFSSSSSSSSTSSISSNSSKPKPSGKLAFLGGGAAPKCKVCLKAVYKMEEIVAMSHTWHKACFRCGGNASDGCGKGLSLDTYTDHGNNPYCNACYGRLFRPKGMGYGNTLNTEEGHRVGISPTKLKSQLETAADGREGAVDKHPSASFVGDGNEVNEEEWD